jgi:hypothetical protein
MKHDKLRGEKERNPKYSKFIMPAYYLELQYIIYLDKKQIFKAVINQKEHESLCLRGEENYANQQVEAEPNRSRLTKPGS